MTTRANQILVATFTEAGSRTLAQRRATATGRPYGVWQHTAHGRFLVQSLDYPDPSPAWALVATVDPQEPRS